MNKRYLIVGGVSAVSLAIGSVAGYFVAKRNFDKTVDGLISAEVEKTKKYFSVLLEETRAGKHGPITTVIRSDKPLDLGDVDEEEGKTPSELSEADKAAIAKGRRTLVQASDALVNYQGYGEKPRLDEVVDKNIFSTDSDRARKPVLPPRGPGGRFVPKSAGQTGEPEQTPYIITQEVYLLNETEYDQCQLRYFRDENTLIDPENNDEAVDIARVGEVNLTLFPEPDEHGYSIICVRNEGLQIDYEVQLVTESLTEYLGLGDSGGSDLADLDDVDDDEDDADERVGDFADARSKD